MTSILDDAHSQAVENCLLDCKQQSVSAL